MAQREYQILIKNLNYFDGKGSDQKEAWDTLSTQRDNFLECLECEVKDPFDLDEGGIDMLKDLEDL